MRRSARRRSSFLNNLSRRLESIEDKDTECIEALFNEDIRRYRIREQEQNLTIDPQSVNDFQVNAARSVVKKQISFVWGPPGTGKTRTLAFAAANLASLGEKVLIVSNTNIAVDVALQKTLEYLNEDNEYFDGKFVRFGVPRLTELEDFPWSLPQYVARDKSPALYATIEKIEKDTRDVMARLQKSWLETRSQS